MSINERVDYFKKLFDNLTSTNSRIEKEYYISQIPTDYKDDFQFIIECLNGKHKFGFTYHKEIPMGKYPMFNTVKQMLECLLIPSLYNDQSQATISIAISMTTPWADFVEPIVNRTLKLGIGNSLLEKEDVSPMLAKKYEGQPIADDIFVTEKLDGNRCIAKFDGEWIFTSRNGKRMHVDFDMSGFDKDYIYDGEVMSREQTENSVKRNLRLKFASEQMFNSTSGLINSHIKDKDLVYNVFDIVNTNDVYRDRRLKLTEMRTIGSKNVRILPVLTTDKLELDTMLDYIVSTGGEGLMINTANGKYQQKRTNDLLKYKQVQTMDMQVLSIEEGTGKCKGLVGALNCAIVTNDGKQVYCKVGSGLNEYQHIAWMLRPDLIVGKFVEVAYFSLSQNSVNNGTNTYSLRFPRLKKVRYDKTEGSEY